MKIYTKNQLRICLTFILILPAMVMLKAQVGIGTTQPNSKAMLEIKSTAKGFLPPRMTPAQRSTIATSLTKAERGLMVADSLTGKQYYWDSAKWTNVTPPLKLPLKLVGDNITLNPGTAAGDLVSWDGVNWISKQPAPASFNFIISKMQPYLVLNYCISLQGIYPTRNGSDPFVGELNLFGFNFAPKGWATCDGQLLPINQNQALFSLLGTTYGGDGRTNFALPDLRGRAALHAGQGPGLSNFTQGQQGGTEAQTISQ